MIVITDSNIIYSALITPDGVVSDILKAKSSIQFYTSEFLFEEVNNHIDKIISLSTLGKKEVKQKIKELKENIKIIDIDKIPKSLMLKAYDITEGVDFYDTPFVAMHLYKGHKIWTSDKELIKGVEAKGYKMFITTAELKDKLYKK